MRVTLVGPDRLHVGTLHWRLIGEPIAATLTIPVAWTSQGWWDLSWLILIPIGMWTGRMAKRAETAVD